MRTTSPISIASLLALLATLGCSSTDLAGVSDSRAKDDKKEDASTTDESNVQSDDEGDEDDVLTEEEINTPADSDKSLQISPKTARMFKGETLDLVAKVKSPGKDDIDVTTKAKWKSAKTSIAKVSKGKVTAVDAGDVIITGSYSGAGSDTSTVTVIECRNVDAGIKATDIRVKGENWPGNHIDAGGADFDDYFVVIHGDFSVDDFQISSNKDQDFSVQFSIGSTGSTSQTVDLQAVDCDGKPTQSKTVSGTTGTQTLHAGKGDRFNLITHAVTGSAKRDYDLLKEKSTAYRIAIEH